MINDVGAIKQSQPGDRDTSMHYTFLCRAVTLVLPVTDAKHRKPVQEGRPTARMLSYAKLSSRKVGQWVTVQT